MITLKLSAVIASLVAAVIIGAVGATTVVKIYTPEPKACQY